MIRYFCAITSWKRQHIKIDMEAFYMVIRKLSEKVLEPFESNSIGSTVWQRKELKERQWDTIWRHFFETELLERKSKNGTSVYFADFIDMDGVAVSVI